MHVSATARTRGTIARFAVIGLVCAGAGAGASAGLAAHDSPLAPSAGQSSVAAAPASASADPGFVQVRWPRR